MCENTSKSNNTEFVKYLISYVILQKALDWLSPRSRRAIQFAKEKLNMKLIQMVKEIFV